MSTLMREAMWQHVAQLRHQPTDKRVRPLLGDRVVADTTAAVLVWEPRRVVPSYAFPAADVSADLVTEQPAAHGGGPPILHPGIPFAVHTTAGESFGVRAGDGIRAAAAFRPADPDLRGH